MDDAAQSRRQCPLFSMCVCMCACVVYEVILPAGDLASTAITQLDLCLDSRLYALCIFVMIESPFFSVTVFLPLYLSLTRFRSFSFSVLCHFHFVLMVFFFLERGLIVAPRLNCVLCKTKFRALLPFCRGCALASRRQNGNRVQRCIANGGNERNKGNLRGGRPAQMEESMPHGYVLGVQ